MNAQHTPGPWTYYPEDNIVATDQGYGIVEVIPRSVHVSMQERIANGYLVAAAPELLALANAYIEWIKPLIKDPGMQAMEAMARAAIAKATGAAA